MTISLPSIEADHCRAGPRAPDAALPRLQRDRYYGPGRRFGHQSPGLSWMWHCQRRVATLARQCQPHRDHRQHHRCLGCRAIFIRAMFRLSAWPTGRDTRQRLSRIPRFMALSTISPTPSIHCAHPESPRRAAQSASSAETADVCDRRGYESEPQRDRGARDRGHPRR